MKNLKIYLAGKMGGLNFEEMNGWRKEMKEKLNKAAIATECCLLNVVNPVDYFNYFNDKHQTEEEVEDYDLAHVMSSDVIVVNLEGLSTSDGTKIELHDASYHRRIPVIAFGDKKLYKDLHPWIKRNITRVEEDMQGVVSYIRDFYMR